MISESAPPAVSETADTAARMNFRMSSSSWFFPPRHPQDVGLSTAESSTGSMTLAVYLRAAAGGDKGSDAIIGEAGND